VTVSIGLALMQPKDSLQNLIARADNALYKAKRQGRNRLCS
jgi:diguanylate cyclase (GGDEF)-like protein